MQSKGNFPIIRQNSQSEIKAKVKSKRAEIENGLLFLPCLHLR